MKKRYIVMSLWVLMAGTGEAQAYIGPGAGLSAFGSLLALIAGALLAVVGFIWYPIKRLLKRRKKTTREPEEGKQETDREC